MLGFGWDIPFVYITSTLFVLFALAFAVSPFSKYWEAILFKTAVSGFWAVALLWLIQFLFGLITQF